MPPHLRGGGGNNNADLDNQGQGFDSGAAPQREQQQRGGDYRRGDRGGNRGYNRQSGEYGSFGSGGGGGGGRRGGGNRYEDNYNGKSKQ